MTILATPTDIENFVMERSPHVKSVDVDTDDDVIVVKITLTFWYRFLYEKTYYRFITNLIKEYRMYGATYDVVITS